MAHAFNYLRTIKGSAQTKGRYYGLTVSGTSYAFTSPYSVTLEVSVKASGAGTTIPVTRMSGTSIVLSGLTDGVYYLVKVTGF